MKGNISVYYLYNFIGKVHFTSHRILWDHHWQYKRTYLKETTKEKSGSEMSMMGLFSLLWRWFFTSIRHSRSGPGQTESSCPLAAGSPTPASRSEFESEKGMRVKVYNWGNKVKVYNWGKKEKVKLGRETWVPSSPANHLAAVTVGFHRFLVGGNKSSWSRCSWPAMSSTSLLTSPGSRPPSPWAHWNWPAQSRS